MTDSIAIKKGILTGPNFRCFVIYPIPGFRMSVGRESEVKKWKKEGVGGLAGARQLRYILAQRAD